MRLIDADQLLDFIKFDEELIAPEERTTEDIVMMIKCAPTPVKTAPCSGCHKVRHKVECGA